MEINSLSDRPRNNGSCCACNCVLEEPVSKLVITLKALPKKILKAEIPSIYITERETVAPGPPDESGDAGIDAVFYQDILVIFIPNCSRF